MEIIPVIIWEVLLPIMVIVLFVVYLKENSLNKKLFDRLNKRKQEQTNGEWMRI